MSDEPDEADFIVTIGDIRATGHCTRGARRLAEANGLNFKEFLKNGISAAELAKSGDAVALDAINKIREKRNGR